MDEVTTRVGKVAVKVLGNEGAPAFLALGGLGRRGAGTDWEESGVASHLSATHRVLLPDPASNPKTTALAAEFAVVRTLTTLGGQWRGACREEWLLDVLPSPTSSEPVVVAGHSWGGGAAARFAAEHPEAVSRLVLVSPDVEWSVARRCWSTPTLLLWAKNDTMNPYIWTSRWSGHPRLTIHTTKTGGHRILEEHAEVISQWLRDQDDRDAGLPSGS